MPQLLRTFSAFYPKNEEKRRSSMPKMMEKRSIRQVMNKLCLKRDLVTMYKGNPIFRYGLLKFLNLKR